MTFLSLELSEPLARAVAARGYVAATPIQQQAIPAIPAILRGGDVIASAPTGSGKTAAYVLPILQALPPDRPKPLRVRALILSPTRELAAQIGASIRHYARHLPYVRTVVAFGGVSINPQMMALRGGADIVVATPGRLLDLVDNHALDLSSAATSCSTRPTACWRWASRRSSSASSRACRRGARTCCSRRRCPRRSRPCATASCATPPASPPRACRPRRTSSIARSPSTSPLAPRCSGTSSARAAGPSSSCSSPRSTGPATS